MRGAHVIISRTSYNISNNKYTDLYIQVVFVVVVVGHQIMIIIRGRRILNVYRYKTPHCNSRMRVLFDFPVASSTGMNKIVST